jgi:hypothetical protein
VENTEQSYIPRWRGQGVEKRFLNEKYSVGSLIVNYSLKERYSVGIKLL